MPCDIRVLIIPPRDEFLPLTMATSPRDMSPKSRKKIGSPLAAYNEQVPGVL